MPRIGEGENSGEKRTPRSGLVRPYERGVRRTVVDGLRRRERVLDGKGVEPKDQIEVSHGWPDPFEENDED